MVENADGAEVRLVEPAPFFTQYPFHRHKLFLHRVAMARFTERLGAGHFRIENAQTVDDALAVLVGRVHVDEIADYWLERDLRAVCERRGLELVVRSSPGSLILLKE